MKKSYAGNGAHTSSLYAATANDSPNRDALVGNKEIDVCIIGAGFSGLSTALHLAEKGYKVAIIEGARVGWGASGRNGGQIVNGLNASLSKIGKQFGEDKARFVASLVNEGGDIIRERVETYGIECDLKKGNILAAISPADMRELESRQKLWESYGITSQEMVNKEGIQKHIGSDMYIGGQVDHKGGHIHPLNLALGEAAAFESLGGVIYEMSQVTSVDTDAPRPVVYTAKGQMSCKTLVICGNAYLGSAVPTLTWRVMPVTTQIMATRRLSDDLASRLLPTDHCVEDIRYIPDYYRISGDKRLLIGGGSVYGGVDDLNIQKKLRRNLYKIFPELKGIEVEYSWSGNFALSFTRVPQMGRIGKNTYFAHGYSGHGVTGTHTFGRILSEAIDGDLKRFDVFAGLPWYPFPGGRVFRVPYSVIGSWWYGLRDKLGV